jgi:cysteine desulfurase
MWANNEVGTLNPIREIGALCHEKGVLFFSDATQAVGKVPVDVEADHVDLLCLSGHKIYGRKASAASTCAARTRACASVAQIDGGGHERGMRSGTLNVPGIVGLGKACELARTDWRRTRSTRASCATTSSRRSSPRSIHVHLNSDKAHPPAQQLEPLVQLRRGRVHDHGHQGHRVSSGSACTSASLEPSHVLRAMGVGDELAHSSIRFGFGRFTTKEQVDFADRARHHGGQAPARAFAALRDGAEGIDLSTVNLAGGGAH